MFEATLIFTESALRRSPGGFVACIAMGVDGSELIPKTNLMANCGTPIVSPPELIVSTNLDVLEAQVLRLNPADREHLFERLIASLDTDIAVEQAWDTEADHREAEFASGLVIPVPGQEALARLRAKLT